MSCRALSAVLCLTLVSGCATSVSDRASGGRLRVVASINAWGSILSQLGGDKVEARSIITNPDTDPHDYEPTAADGRRIADAQLLVENGIGYDAWAAKALAANPSPTRQVVDVGRVVGVAAGGNPHRWYDPADVDAVANAITAQLKELAPGDATYFDQQCAKFERQGLAQYHRLISEIRTRFAGVKVGASESIFAPLAGALGLDLVTPASFLKAISEGSDPSPQDLLTVDRQIADREISVYVYNSQNATPDVAQQVRAARARGIPVTTVTETLSPANATFEQWQVAQLTALRAALARA